MVITLSIFPRPLTVSRLNFKRMFYPFDEVERWQSCGGIYLSREIGSSVLTVVLGLTSMKMLGLGTWLTEDDVRTVYKEIPGIKIKILDNLLYHIIGHLNLIPSSRGLSSVFTLDNSQSEKGPQILERIGTIVQDYLDENQMRV
jgi:hypothetical protein